MNASMGFKVTHTLSEPLYRAIDGEPLATGLVAIVCSCGFRVTNSRDRATAIAHGHVERARVRREGYPPQSPGHPADPVAPAPPPNSER